MSSMSALHEQTCVPCRGGVPPMQAAEIREYLGRLTGWSVEGDHHLVKPYPFPDFAVALAFVNEIGRLAEAQGHHPDIHLSWGMVRVQIWTHKIDGLTESDFILAAKIDRLRAGPAGGASPR
ncbi:MAG: 4a-hydroxytetrahydrobiopterin dehydratase [Gammaproteobacteria bacterium]|nr:MAG: 4a-hydroxytetrahydrobiopterin dehydratase [Gammaproteobacteria bacterium]